MPSGLRTMNLFTGSAQNLHYICFPDHLGNFFLLALKMPTTIYLSRHLIRNNLYFKVVCQFCLFWTLLLLFSKVHRDRTRGQGHMVAARNISFGKTFSHEDSQTLEQATQRDCEISTPGDIQSMSGQGFEQSHLRYSCSNWRVTPMTYGNPFQKKSLVYDSYPLIHFWYRWRNIGSSLPRANCAGLCCMLAS